MHKTRQLTRLAPLAVLLLLLTAPAVVQAQFNYTISAGTVAITGYTGTGGAVAIPSAIDGLPVTSIGENAFLYGISLTSVTIPGSVRTIGEFAFAYCTSMASVTIPGSVTSIGLGTFEYCTSLTSVAIPSGVTSIGNAAFAECTGLTSVTIPNSVTSIGEGAFDECNSLTSVKGGNGIVGIGEYAFESCASLTSVTIPASVTSIGEDAFAYCTSLSSVTIPGSVSSIGLGEFFDCTSLTSVTIASGVREISAGMFVGCTSLSSITIPGSVTAVGSNAFTACTSLTSVYFMGNAPSANSSVFALTVPAAGTVDPVTVYYLSGTTGWRSSFAGVPAVMLNPPILTGSLQVTITPVGAINAGAQWQVDGGTFENSGAAVTNLAVGNHTVSFNTVNGWTTPDSQALSIKTKAVAKTTGAYTFAAKGIYNGLFAQQADTTVGTAGMLSGLTVTASGNYSGKILIGDSTNSISGSFNVSGQSSNDVPRVAKQGGPLALEMTLNWNASPPQITGTVSGTNGGPWVAILTAEMAASPSASAEYTALVLPAGTPPGYGYLLLTNHAGAVVLSGALADGTSFSQSVPVSGNGDLPFYANLYGGAGLLIGWIGLESGSLAGNLTWIKEASRFTTLYTNGFTNMLSVQGSPWINQPPHTAAIDLRLGQLDVSGGSLLSPLSFSVAVSNNNALVKLPGSPTNSLTGSINPKTGLLTVTFGNGAGKATTSGTGAVLQNVTNAAGFFLGKTNAGSILLKP